MTTKMSARAAGIAVLSCLTGWSAANAQYATHYWDGSNTTSWATADNWRNLAMAPTGVTASVRLEIRGVGAPELIYDAANGDTVYNTAGTGNPRSLLIYPGGALRITGGLFETRGTMADIVCVNAGAAHMVIDGGTFVRTNEISGSQLLIGYGSGANATFTVSNGWARIRQLEMGNNSGTATGAVFASGGTLEVGSFVKGAGVGTFFFDGGVVRASQDNADWLGSGLPVRITGNGAAIDTAGHSVGINRYLINSNGAGGLTVYGGGVLTIGAGANNSYAGPTAISNATLRLGANSGIPNGAGKGNVVLADGGMLDLGGYGDTVNGLAGGGLVDNTLDVGSYNLTLGDGDASAVFTGRVQNTSGIVNLFKIGSGSQTLGGGNAYDGTTTVNGGELRIAHPNALGTTAGGTIVNNNSRLVLEGGCTVVGEALALVGNGGNSFGALQSASGLNEWRGDVTLGADMTRIGADAAATLVVSGAIGDGGAGHGLRIRNPDAAGTAVVELSGANTWGGGTEIWHGILRLAGGNDRLPTTTAVQLGFGASGFSLAGQLDLNGQDQEIAGLSVNPNVTEDALKARQVITNSAAATTSTLTVSNIADCTFPGLLVAGAGTVALTKQGTGILTLEGDNTYEGPTVVEGGELRINGTQTGAGLITVNNGTLGGRGTVGPVTVNSGGTLAPGESIGTFTVNGDLSLAGTLHVEVDGTGLGSVDLLNVSGLLDISAATVKFQALTALDDVYVFAAYGSLNGSQFSSVVNLPSGYAIDYAYAGNQIALIPEPASLWLMAGLLAVAWIRRRMRG